MLNDNFPLALHELLARDSWCDMRYGWLWVSRLRINRAHWITDAEHSLDTASLRTARSFCSIVRHIMNLPVFTKRLRELRSAWGRTKQPHQDKDRRERAEVDEKLEGSRAIGVADQSM